MPCVFTHLLMQVPTPELDMFKLKPSVIFSLACLLPHAPTHSLSSFIFLLTLTDLLTQLLTVLASTPGCKTTHL